MDPLAAAGLDRSGLKGPDAADFLHRITSADVHALSPGEGTRAAILSPTGRYEASFYLWREAPDAFALETWGGKEWKDRLLATIDRYTFAEKMTLESNLEPSVGNAESPGWRSLVQLGSAPFTEARIASLLPFPGREITPERNPLEAGDSEAVADQKGCYPGQEVIEKIRALGAPAKRLVRVRSTTSLDNLPTEIPLLDPETGVEVGRLTTAQGFHGLAIVRKTHASKGLKLKTASCLFEVEMVSEERKGRPE